MPFLPRVPILYAARPRDVPARLRALAGHLIASRCANCGADLLLSPSSAQQVAAGLAQPACIPCVDAHFTGRTFVPVMTTDQAAELAELQRRLAEQN